MQHLTELDVGRVRVDVGGVNIGGSVWGSLCCVSKGGLDALGWKPAVYCMDFAVFCIVCFNVFMNTCTKWQKWTANANGLIELADCTLSIQLKWKRTKWTTSFCCTTSFLRATAGTAVAHLSHHNSVCLSVCLSHGWISQKLCKLESPNLHRWLPKRF